MLPALLVLAGSWFLNRSLDGKAPDHNRPGSSGAEGVARRADQLLAGWRVTCQVREEVVDGEPRSWTIGGPAPSKLAIRAAVQQARTDLNAKVIAQERVTSPGAIGEGWEIVLTDPDPNPGALPPEFHGTHPSPVRPPKGADRDEFPPSDMPETGDEYPDLDDAPLNPRELAFTRRGPPGFAFGLLQARPPPPERDWSNLEPGAEVHLRDPVTEAERGSFRDRAPSGTWSMSAESDGDSITFDLPVRLDPGARYGFADQWIWGIRPGTDATHYWLQETDGIIGLPLDEPDSAPTEDEASSAAR